MQEMLPAASALRRGCAAAQPAGALLQGSFSGDGKSKDWICYETIPIFGIVNDIADG